MWLQIHIKVRRYNGLIEEGKSLTSLEVCSGNQWQKTNIQYLSQLEYYLNATWLHARLARRTETTRDEEYIALTNSLSAVKCLPVVTQRGDGSARRPEN